MYIILKNLKIYCAGISLFLAIYTDAANKTLLKRGIRAFNSSSRVVRLNFKISSLAVFRNMLGLLEEHIPVHSLSISFKNNNTSCSLNLSFHHAALAIWVKVPRQSILPREHKSAGKNRRLVLLCHCTSTTTMVSVTVGASAGATGSAT